MQQNVLIVFDTDTAGLDTAAQAVPEPDCENGY